MKGEENINIKDILKVISSITYAILITLTIIIAIVAVPFSIIVHAVSTEFYVKDFDLYRDDFLMIAEKMISLDKELGLTDGENIYIRYDENHNVYYQLDNNNTYFIGEESTAIKDIEDALYKAGGLGRIVIYKDRITFIADGNWYAVAYMINNKKPTFMSDLEENRNIKVKRIEKYWYHIRSKG